MPQARHGAVIQVAHTWQRPCEPGMGAVSVGWVPRAWHGYCELDMGDASVGWVLWAWDGCMGAVREGWVL